MSVYQDLFDKGKYDALYNQAIDDHTLNGSYWQIVALTFRGEYDQALSKSNLLHDDFINCSDLKLKSKYLQILGNLYSYMGNLDVALETYKQALQIREGLNDKTAMASTLNVIAINYSIRGQLDKALDYQLKSLKIKEQAGSSDSHIAASLESIAGIYRRQNKLDKAFKYYSEALKLDRKTGNLLHIVSNLGSLAVLEVKRGNKSSAQKYLDKINKIVMENESERLQAQYNRAKATVLKYSSRIVDQAESQKLLRDIIKSDDTNHSMRVYCYGDLLDLLLLEYQQMQDNAILEEIREIMTQYITAAREHEMYQHLIKSLILRAKLSVVDGDFATAEKMLTQAMVTSEENNLTGLLIEAEEAKEAIYMEIKQMQKLLDRNSKFKERYEKSQLYEYIKKVKGYQYGD